MIIFFNVWYLIRNISKLLDGIEPVLDDPAKLSILHYMSGLLPDSEQSEFDRAAARIFAKQSDGKLGDTNFLIVIGWGY